MKKSILILAPLLGVSLLCCGFSYTGSESKIKYTVNDTYASSDEAYGTVTIDGKNLQLPFVEGLMEDELNYVVEDKYRAYDPYSATYSEAAYDDNGRCVELYIENNEDQTLEVTKCNVYAIKYDATQDTNYGGPVNFSINGVKIGDDVSKATQVFGAPSYSNTWQGVTTVTFESPKKDRTIKVYNDSSNKIIMLESRVETSGQEYRYAHERNYDLESDKRTVDLPGSDNPMPGGAIVSHAKSVMVEIASALFVIVVSLIIVLGAVLLFHKKVSKEKRRQAEIDLKILNTDLDDDYQDLIDKK